MTDPTIIPPQLIRQYAWAVLKANDPTTWNEARYGGKIPIVPLGEEPDIEQYDGPTIVYEYGETHTQGTMYMRGRGTMSFGIHDTTFRRLARTTNVLKEALGRFDDSARDINAYLQARGTPWNEISFGYVSLVYVDGGTPAIAEGGSMMAIVAIDFDYFVDYDVITSV